MRNQKNQKRKKSNVQEFEWKQVLNLTKEEAKKCRFKIIDQNWRLVECKVHKNHGFRIHPIHLWYLDEKGQLYRRIDNKLVVWYDWLYAKKKESGRAR